MPLLAVPTGRRPTRGVLAVLLVLLAWLPAAAAETSKEYLIKAAFLYNFTQFVEWPGDAFADAAAPIRIGILGDDPFGAALDEVVRGETVRNRPLVVVRAQRAEDLKDCHLVFVGRSEAERTEGVLEEFASAPILTVSDNPDFTTHGGVVRFFLDGTKVRFEINPAAAEGIRLKLSAQLLTLGKLVPRLAP